MTTTALSIVVPLFDEEENVPELVGRLFETLRGRSFEVIFVDDGSRDRTLERLLEATRGRPEARVVELARNFGQHAAVLAGLEIARGEVVVTLDADLQNPPEEIPKLLAKIDEGWDVVGGWRRRREDPLFRRFASRCVNSFVGWVTGVRLHDYGCMLRAYRRPVATGLARHGATFIPALANRLAARVTEVEVAHAPRTRGESKYPLGKLVRLSLDLVATSVAPGFGRRAEFVVRRVHGAAS